MGRRSTSTTKGGRYMNPTDQARKEARRKELKKNKKQRKMVREAVLRSRNPKSLLDEVEKLENQELEAGLAALPNDKSTKDKRRRLKDSFEKTMRLYEKEDPERFGEYRRMEVEYEQRRKKTLYCYESKRKALAVQLDDIPLPDATSDDDLLPDSIPLPSEDYDSSLPANPDHSSSNAHGPGNDDDDEEDNTDDESSDESDTDSNAYEDDQSEENSEIDEDDLPTRLQDETSEGQIENVPAVSSTALPSMLQTNAENSKERTNVPQVPPSLFMARLPGRPFLSQVPPGPPPGLPPRMPPGPPPGPPPAILRPGMPPPMPGFLRGTRPPLNVAQAAPSQQSFGAGTEIKDEAVTESGSKKSINATITAKPQLRSSTAEVKKFVPLALRVRRDLSKPKAASSVSVAPAVSSSSSLPDANKYSTDVAYADFMKEIEGFL